MELRVCSSQPFDSLLRAIGYITNETTLVYKTEQELGIGIKESGVEREKLFVVTKVDSPNIHNIEGALQTSLKKLQLDYVDL